MESNTNSHSMIKKLLGQEVDSWQWVGKRWKRNRVKHKQTEHDKKTAGMGS